MPYVKLVSYSGPPSQVQVSSLNDPSLIYVYPNTITNATPMPLNIQLPVANWGNIIILSAYSVSNGCSFLGQASCSIEPTPTPTPFYCYYTAIQPTDAWSAGDDITILDCNGVTSAFTATSSAVQYLCVQSATGNASYEVLDENLGNCIEIAGEWYPENPVGSPTPTPTNAVTPTPSPTDPLYSNEYVEYYYSVYANNTIGVQLQIGLLDYTIDWGDGNTSAYTTSNQTLTHTYASTSTGYLRISGNTLNSGQVPGIYNTTFYGNGSLTGFTSEIGKLIDLYDLTADYFITGDINDLSACNSLITIFTKSNDINGNISNLPTTCRFVTITGDNTLSGDLSSLPSSIIELDVWGNNTISGNTSYLTSYTYLTNFGLEGFNTLSGNCSALTGITYLNIRGYNTISGNIVFGPNNDTYTLQGYNTVGGDISLSQPSHMSSLTELIIDGYNQISGQLAGFIMPLESFAIGGNNTISGSTTLIPLNQTLTSFRLDNIPTVTVDTYVQYSTTGNTLTGPLSAFLNAPGCWYITIGGNNTISGGLNDTFAVGLSITSTGNTINTASSWMGAENYSDDAQFNLVLYTQSSTKLPSSEVNGLFADLIANLPTSPWSVSETTISILGTHSGPTGQGITNKNTLVGYGAYIQTN